MNPEDDPLAEAFEALDELEGPPPDPEAMIGREVYPPVVDTGPGFLAEVVDTAEAVVLGIGDTLSDMLRAGREGARKAQAEYWQRFDQKTKYRRKPKPDA